MELFQTSSLDPHGLQEEMRSSLPHLLKQKESSFQVIPLPPCKTEIWSSPQPSKRKGKSLTSSLNNKKRVPLKFFVVNQEYFFVAESA